MYGHVSGVSVVQSHNFIPSLRKDKCIGKPPSQISVDMATK